MKRYISITLTTAALLLSTSAFAGGANIGSTNLGSQFLIEWCRGNLGLLEDARSQADLSVLDGDFETASQVLEQAFQTAAAQSHEKSDYSMVYRALMRTLKMNEALNELEHQPALATPLATAKFVFLDSSIDLITRHIAPLDTTYYIPTRFQRMQCNNCDVSIEEQFEKRFQETARREIDWFLNEFATVEARTGATIPKFSAKVYLKILEFMTLFVAEDLGDSLWKARYSCSEQQLKRLNSRLAAYNSGNIAAFKDDRRAVISATSELKQVRDNLSRHCGQ